MVFVEASAFTRYVASYLNDDEYRRLQTMLAANPKAGALIRDTGGFRKVRWPDSRRRKGARGGLRVIYFHFADEAQIWLITLYGKDEVQDLTADQRRSLRSAIDVESRERARRRHSPKPRSR